jgi:hypothetical protein
MFECPTCKKTYESKNAFSSHWGLVCKPGARGILKGESHPKFGKKGRNGYTTRDWSLISFDNLKSVQRRKRLLEECNYSCTSCGFSKTRECGGTILEVDHIDGDHMNNSRENLRVLCPNCHALTPNFRNWGRSSKEKTSKRLRKGNTGFTAAQEEKNNLLKEFERAKSDFQQNFVNKVMEFYESGKVNFSEYGWVQILADHLNESPQVIGRRVRTLLPDFYAKNCFSRSYVHLLKQKTNEIYS